MKHKILISFFITFLSLNSKAQQVINDDGDSIRCTGKIWTKCEKSATFSNSDSTNIKLLKDAVKKSDEIFYGITIFDMIVNANGETKEVNVIETNMNNFNKLKSLFKQINYKFNAAMHNRRKVCFFQKIKISIIDDFYEIKCLK
ncbi:MAG: hypothetical protein KA319_14395 [Ferruginibacter sp.]|nr:hypothetical protein [Ferruginibacter sp.]